MKASKKSVRGKSVPKELTNVLNRLAGDIRASRRAEARRLLGNGAFGDIFERCTWWNGCYYCQGIDGKWRVIECYA